MRRERRVLNVTDLVNRAFTDAQVNRWRFPGGDLFAPEEVVSTGQYTRNDRRLEHDFFYMMNDHRCDGAAETACGETSFMTSWCSKASSITACVTSSTPTIAADLAFPADGDGRVGLHPGIEADPSRSLPPGV
jgi:hypothetical protein